MSLEAMMITIGITFMFLPNPTILIPITIALAHFGYSAFTFLLVRTKKARRLPVAASHIISGLALVAYGLGALIF